MNIIKWFKRFVRGFTDPTYLSDCADDLFDVYSRGGYIFLEDYVKQTINIRECSFKLLTDTKTKTTYIPFIYKGVPVKYKR